MLTNTSAIVLNVRTKKKIVSLILFVDILGLVIVNNIITILNKLSAIIIKSRHIIHNTH